MKVIPCDFSEFCERVFQNIPKPCLGGHMMVMPFLNPSQDATSEELICILPCFPYRRH